MRDPTIARNYAEALLALARRAGDLPGWGAMISDVSDALQRDETLRLFLESPRITAEQKNEVLARAFQDRMPTLFVRFLQAVVSHNRQRLIPEIAIQYHDIVDEIENRVHAHVTVAREPDPATQSTIAAGISRAFGKTVVPHFLVRPDILGGVVVRVGDVVMDGSVRNRLRTLRQRMLAGAR